MFLRSSRWAASVLAFGMSAANVVAQPPAAPASAPPASDSLITPPSVYPQAESNYSFNEGGNFYDELDLSPRFRFQADWVYLTRSNRARDPQVIEGPDTFRMRDVKFDYSSGYRLNLAFMNDDYELEASYMTLEGLGGSKSGTLSRSLVFDGSGAYDAAMLPAQLAIDADLGPNFLNSGTYFAPLNAAANNIDAVTAVNDETNELETLQPNAVYFARYSSDLQDFEVNLKGRQQTGRLFRFGFGYRNVRLNETGLVQLRGVFDTFDTDGDDMVSNAPNNALSDSALTVAGLTGTGTTGFSENISPIAPDTLLFTSNTNTSNVLNGLQATLDATFAQSEYFELGGFARAGVYHNDARGRVSESYRSFTGSGVTYSRSFSDSKDRVAFVGNLGLTGRLMLGENVHLFSAYEVNFLSGVALAPDQLRGFQTDLTGTTSLDLQTHGTAVFHGVRVGLEILFP